MTSFCTCQQLGLQRNVINLYIGDTFFRYFLAPPKALSIEARSIHEPDICVNLTWKLNGDGGGIIRRVWMTVLDMKEILPTNGSQRQVPIGLDPQKVN